MSNVWFFWFSDICMNLSSTVSFRGKRDWCGFPVACLFSFYRGRWFIFAFSSFSIIPDNITWLFLAQFCTPLLNPPRSMIRAHLFPSHSSKTRRFTTLAYYSDLSSQGVEIIYICVACILQSELFCFIPTCDRLVMDGTDCRPFGTSNLRVAKRDRVATTVSTQDDRTRL